MRHNIVTSSCYSCNMPNSKAREITGYLLTLRATLHIRQYWCNYSVYQRAQRYDDSTGCAMCVAILCLGAARDLDCKLVYGWSQSIGSSRIGWHAREYERWSMCQNARHLGHKYSIVAARMLEQACRSSRQLADGNADFTMNIHTSCPIDSQSYHMIFTKCVLGYATGSRPHARSLTGPMKLFLLQHLQASCSGG